MSVGKFRIWSVHGVWALSPPGYPNLCIYWSSDLRAVWQVAGMEIKYRAPVCVARESRKGDAA